MKIAILICRILSGLIFTVFGLNQFLHFIPMEAPTGDAGVFFTGMVKSVYLIPTMGFFMTASGIALLVNRFVLVALVILFPLILNILLFHIFLEPNGLAMAIALMAMNLFLVYANRDHFMHFKNPTHHID